MSNRGQRGTLRQLPDGRWQARYWESGRGSRRPSRIFETRSEGSDWLRQRLDELERVRAGDRSSIVLRRESARTGSQACRDYLAAHEVDAATTRKLTSQLRQFEASFGERALQSLEEYELAIWKRTVPHDVWRAARQMLAQAARWHWIPVSPAAGIRAPKPRRAEVVPPPWEAVLTLAEEIDLRLEALPIFAAGTGLRIEEWIALERRDLDLEARVVRVRRVRSASGEIRELGADGSKSWRQRRDVPLRAVVVEALAAMMPRIDTPLVFAAPRGGYLHPVTFHRKFWRPAFVAAGLEPFPPKDLRYVYASESLAASIDLFTLSRRMGTSLKEIDETYGHLVDDSHERELAQLDAYDAARGRIAEDG